jgi:hypothetical protein
MEPVGQWIDCQHIIAAFNFESGLRFIRIFNLAAFKASEILFQPTSSNKGPKMALD